jgi:hypothetical protein
VGESMNGPWSESRDAGNPHVRFDERDLETGPSRSPRQISTLPVLEKSNQTLSKSRTSFGQGILN